MKRHLIMNRKYTTFLLRIAKPASKDRSTISLQSRHTQSLAITPALAEISVSP